MTYGDEAALRPVRGRHARDAPWLTQTAVDMPALTERDTQPLPRFTPFTGGGLQEWQGLRPTFTPRRRPRIVAMVPVYNGGDHPPVEPRSRWQRFRRFIRRCFTGREDDAGLGAAIESLLAQTWPIDEIVVMPNGCTDNTSEIAHRYPVTVWDLPKDPHKKAGVLNKGWRKFCQDADLVVCIDDDTRLPKRAVEHWVRELEDNPMIGGSSSQPVMTGNDLLSRIQRAEFAESATLSLRRGWCRVVSGTGCMYRNEALREVALLPGYEDGPWTYRSVVEDYHLTFMLRKLGWLCVMSPDVYCLTGSMKTVKALWHQRIKWQSGTIGDLINFGCSRLNWREWSQQVFGLATIVFWLFWLTLNISALAVGRFHPSVTWAVYSGVFMTIEVFHAWHIHQRDWKDFALSGLLVKSIFCTWLTMGYIMASWWIILRGSKRDLWKAQYSAEGIEDEVRDDDGSAAGGGSSAQQAVGI